MRCPVRGRSDPRLVGDPIDVVSGACTDVVRDFELAGPLPLDWRRHYDSSKSVVRFSLGWGHAHSYDRSIKFDADGISYLGPLGQEIGFPPLWTDGETASAGGYILERISASVFQLHRPRSPSAEFWFRDSTKPARILRVWRSVNEIRFTYSPDGLLEAISDSLGRRIRVGTLEGGLINKLSLRDEGSDREILLQEYAYDPAGNLIEGRDAYGHTFRFEYDAQNRMIRRTDRRGYSFLFTYDNQGRCVHSGGEDGLHDTRLQYLGSERVTLVTRADGGRWTYMFDESGVVLRIIDPYGGTKNLLQDNSGRVIAEIDDNGNSSQILYTPHGAPGGRILPNGRFLPEGAVRPPTWIWGPRYAERAIEFDYGDLFWPGLMRPAGPEPAWTLPPSVRAVLAETRREQSPDLEDVHNAFGLLVKKVWSRGDERRYTYDPNGNVRHSIDRDGAERRFEYVGWNQLYRVTDGLGRTVLWRETATEKVRATTDPSGSTTEYVYDLKDRLVQIRRHGVVKEQYVYDHADNLIQKRDGDGNVLLTFEIGPGNQKIVRRLASGGTHSFRYDDVGRVLEASTEEFRTTFSYDQWGKQAEDLRDGRGLRHEFDDVGRVVRTTVLDRFRIEFQESDERIVVTDPCGGRQIIRKTRDGLFLRELSNGSGELSLYDRDGRCLLKSHFRGETAWIRRYRYSGERDLIEERDDNRGFAVYGYDAAHRLISARRGEQEERFAYDAGDNLVSKTGLDSVTLLQGNRVATANGDEFEHGVRNHVIRRGHTRFHYDSRDQLVTVERPGLDFRAIYDPLGRRVEKRVNGSTTQYFWDEDRLAAEIRSDGKVRIYVYARSLALVPILFVDYESVDADPAAGKCYFVFTNQIGTPVRVEDATGRTVWSARVDPYGTTRVNNGATIDMSLRFPGHYHDTETELHYNRFRYYSPELGRYLQPDPAGLAGGLNLYAYTASPLSRVDVRGLGCGDEAAEAPPPKPKDGLDDEEVKKPSELPKTDKPGRFSDFEDGVAAETRESLKAKGFVLVKREFQEHVPYREKGPDGEPVSKVGFKNHNDKGSEIWMRRNADGSFDAVRVDRNGHPVNPNWASNQGHGHMEHIPADYDPAKNGLPPGSTTDDAANKYAENFIPGVDKYDNKGNLVDQSNPFWDPTKGPKDQSKEAYRRADEIQNQNHQTDVPKDWGPIPKG